MKRSPSVLPLLFAVGITAGAVGFVLVKGADSNSESNPGWRAGAASVVITPEAPTWMAGYGGRKAPADGTKLTELWAKALVLEDQRGHRGLILSLDLVGIDREMASAIAGRIETAHGLKREQVTIATSHTHSGPVVGRRNLGPLHWWRLEPEHQAGIDAYEAFLLERVAEAVDEAMAELAPARVQAGSGFASFAVNRRENKPYAEVPERRKQGRLKGPVDHDVPVLSVRDPDSGAVRAILFGYACHATVLSGMSWCGDFPGYAQIEMEKAYPDCVALFWAGCGADQNPLPRKTVPLAERYGAALAGAVREVIEAPMADLAPDLSTRFREIEAPLAEVPPLDEWREIAETGENYEQARARFLLHESQKPDGGSAVGLDGTFPYPVGVWSLGGGLDGIDFIWLGGEVVVDYALRLKRERRGERTWVAAYANDVMAYIPSRRVLEEGGYEGGGSNVYYGLPALWDETIEAEIVEAVHEIAPRTDLKR